MTRYLNGSDERIDVRCEIRRDVLDVIDAVILAAPKGTSRSDVVGLVLEEWAEKKIHESTLVVRITKSNGSASA